MWVLCFEELESIMPKIDSLQSAEFFVQFNMIWYRREFQICFTEMIVASMGHCFQTCPNATPKPCLNATQLGYGCPQIYHLVKKFHEIQIFAIFATHDQNTKIINHKNLTHEFCVNFWTHGNFHTCVLCTSLAHSDDDTVPLFQTSRRRPILSHRTSFVLR